MSQSPSTTALSPEPGSNGVPRCDLAKYRGQWLAFDADGRLIAGCKTLKELDEQVRAAGENPEDVFLQQIPDGDSILSGSELS